MTSTRPSFARSLIRLLATFTCFTYALSLPSSYPHVYPGQPSGDFSPKWQNYFHVKDPLPNVTFPVGRSFAGNLPVQRPNHPNNTLFFYGFEKSEGSLTAEPNATNDEPWGIWLNGGPGSSSMFGLFFENGPIRINQDYSASPNNYSWDKLSDYFWIDQPVGVGFATADADGYVTDEDAIGRDFMGFLGNLVKVFPSLRKRPLYLTGESYAGMYIPYITKAYFNMQDPPVRIAKILIGDGSITSGQVFELLPSLSVIETFPQIIGYNQDVYKYFKAQTHLCGYDVNLTYPQTTPLPSISFIPATARDVPFALNTMSNYEFMQELSRRAEERGVDKEEPQQGLVKRDATEFLRDRRFDEIDPWYGCVLIQMYLDYALNYTFPWSSSKNSTTFGFDVYDVQDATNPRWMGDAGVFLNDDRVRTALHAPTSKDWEMTFDFVFGEAESHDPSVEAMAFLSDLATNMTAQNIGVVLYSGNNDALIPHRSTEIAIQNTTFGGIRGFTRKPSTSWHSDDGTFAGIIHQERNWTYALFTDASHLVPQSVPAAAFTFFREFVIGNNRTGLVIDSGEQATVVGGEDPALAGDVIPGGDEIYYGSMATQSTHLYPEATRSAWREFIRTETAKPLPTSLRTSRDDNGGDKTDLRSWKHVFLGIFLGIALTLL